MTNSRERIEQIEAQLLSPFAARAAASGGRQRPEPECSIRTCYQRDRDRIIHCKAFRRLKHKTQVFLSPEGDHYRTRLTHTLEVSQIARTIARALALNEDLTEAIALGHDLGHTPFGHAGEAALNVACSLGFAHNEQSLRVVDKLENDGQGLNLTAEVRDGIVSHTYDKRAATLEGHIVALADRIAYMNHDIEDAIRAGVLSEQDIPSDLREALGDTKSVRINNMVLDTIENSSGRNEIMMSPMIADATARLHAFMFARVYTNPVAKADESKAKDILARLYQQYMKCPQELPEDFRHYIETEGLERTVCDYIAGMTDNFCINEFRRLFIPRGWQVL